MAVTLISEEVFKQRFIQLCEEFDVRETALYGRFAQQVNEKGQLCPPDRLIWLNGEKMVAEEAEYHFGRIADGHAS